MKIRGDGVVLIGSSTVQQGSTSKLEVMGTLNNSYPGYSYPIMVSDDAAYNSSGGPGGGIGFSFKQNSGGAYAQAGGVRGIKENTTDGNYASALTFYTRANGGGTAERLRIDSRGCVRVGNTATQSTSSNTKRIALGAKGSIQGWVSGQLNGHIQMIDNYYWDGSNNKAIESDYCAYLSLRSGTLRFGSTASSQTGGNNVSGGIHERLRIKADSAILHTRSDNVGRHDVEFRQTGGIGSGNFGGIKWTQGSTGGTFLAGITIAYHDTGRPAMVFYQRDGGGTGSRQTVNIDRDGTMIIGEATDAALAVNQSTGRGVNLTANGRVFCKTADHWDLNQVSGGQMIRFRYGNDSGSTQTHVGHIQVNSSSVTYSTSASDSRLKKNIATWTDEVLPLFKTLQPKKFNYNWETDSDAKSKGYIAQDLISAFPEAYPIGKVDVDGSEEDRYMFAPGGMVTYLMKALQEEIAKREALEARIAALEGS